MATVTLIRKTLRDVRGSTIGIALLTAFMALVDVLIYPSYKDSLGDFQLPEAMQGFIGSDVTIGSPEGFITAEFFSWIPLVLTILAISGGTGAFAGEESAGTMDLLLTQPITRWRLTLAKTSALLLAITVAALASLIGFAIAKRFVDFDIGMGRLAVATVSMLPVTFLVLGLSLWASARFPNRAVAAMIMTGMVVIFYFIQILGEAAPVLRTIRKISPFYWSESSRVLLHGFAWARSGALLLLASIAIAAAGWAFERRDISAGVREWHFRYRGLRRAFGRSVETADIKAEG